MSEQQRLDNMSKILLATSTINYMANTINGVSGDYRLILSVNSAPESTISEIFKKATEDDLVAQQNFLSDMTARLSGIVEEFADYINSKDMICQIDQRINSVPCDILLLGKDLVDEDYDVNDAPFNETTL